MERTPPPPFVCPITMDLMDNAVIDLDGYSYDRAAIEEVLQRSRASPMTRRPMAHTDLIPNRALRDAIAAWEREQPMAIDPDLLTLDDPRAVIGRGAFGEVRYISRYNILYKRAWRPCHVHGPRPSCCVTER